MSTLPRRLLAAAAVGVASTAVVAGVPVAAAQPATGQDCAALLVLGVQGAGQAAADAAPDTDSGVLGQVFRPMLADAPQGSVQRLYVPLALDPAAAGGAGAGGTAYSRGIEDAVAALSQTASDFVARCPEGQVAVAGAGQGAQVASQFAQLVARGAGGVPADQVAGVALFGDPSRNPAAALFPGRPGKTVPDAAPGTSGGAVARMQALAQQPLTGGGIGPQRGAPTDFGALAGRVASFCIAGDLACDTPEQAPILRVVSNIVAAADQSGGDPLRALASVTQALAFTAIKTVTNVVNNDIHGNSLASLSLSTRTSLSARMAEASDPRTPLQINDVLKAVLKVGTIALNSVITVAKAVITPTNIAEIAAAGLANPAAGLAVLGQKLLGALPQLVPPTTVSRLVNQAFEAVVSNVAENTGLVDTTTGVKYSDAITSRGAYTAHPVAADGATPVQFTADWFSALAHDLTATKPAPSTPRSSTPTPAAGTSTTATPTPARSQTPNGGGLFETWPPRPQPTP
ncbi:cutinase family protein [Nocardia amamiensis]|uniref:Cutinase family protein n=1 Tax=Nocardia amamiensis TaxID=404578 RepID=A0ABS0D5N6_9NOCA|nr:cutinase family protein [Nocardia amamiensis]MBF6302458.1 cutinase family protein [Nocardia amamiensis]